MTPLFSVRYTPPPKRIENFDSLFCHISPASSDISLCRLLGQPFDFLSQPLRVEDFRVRPKTEDCVAKLIFGAQTQFIVIIFPVFTLSQEEREALAKSSVSDFYKLYKTPFERVRDDLRDIWCRKSVTGNLQSFYPRLQTLRQIHIKYQRIDAVGTEHSLILISYSTTLTLFTRANG